MDPNIFEDRAQSLVVIDGVEVHGWVDDEHLSKCCLRLRVYSEPFDAYFCPFCHQWLEKACDDPRCDYCPERPATPLG